MLAVYFPNIPRCDQPAQPLTYVQYYLWPGRLPRSDPRRAPVLVALLHNNLALGFQRPNDLDILLRATLQEILCMPVHCKGISQP
jgi:hypothetical protein